MKSGYKRLFWINASNIGVFPRVAQMIVCTRLDTHFLYIKNALSRLDSARRNGVISWWLYAIWVFIPPLSLSLLSWLTSDRTFPLCLKNIMGSMALPKTLRIGVDVGGTNTWPQPRPPYCMSSNHAPVTPWFSIPHYLKLQRKVFSHIIKHQPPVPMWLTALRPLFAAFSSNPPSTGIELHV